MNKCIFIFLCFSIQIFASEQEFDKNITDVQTSEYFKKWEHSNFGLKPHLPNYVLLYGFRDGSYTSYDANSREYTNIEAQLQISLKINVAKDILNLGEKYYLAYSHRAFWQIYIESSPFRETNYNPEAFVVFPILDTTSIFKLHNLIVGYSHNSNGQGDNGDLVFRSRSVNYMYTTLSLKHDFLITEFTFFAPFMGNDLSDNPDIIDYLGCSEVKFSYFTGKHMFTLRGRGNITTGNGAVEATYSYPLVNDVHLYGKIFSGYGESLIDYNNYITKFSVGFSFSR